MNRFETIFGTAKWIAPTDADAYPVIRQSFTLERVPQSATLNIVGFGGYSVCINGKNVTQDLLLPLNTDFEKRETPSGEETAHRILCESYPVADLLCEGKNTIAVLLGEGWYTGVAREKPFGRKKVCFRLLETDSGRELVCSDLGAKWTPSFVTEGKFDRGERQDYTDWDDAMLSRDYDDRAWQNVREARAPVSNYEFSDCPRDRVIKAITPTLLAKDKNGALYDAGVNLSGYPVLRAKNGRITVRFSEILNECGTLAEKYGHNQYLEYTLDGTERLLYPRFAWIGFRYFYVEGDAEVVAVHKVHSDIDINSAFETSDETLNWIYRTYLNTQLCNMHNGIPSDCPQIERRGYTGDGQLVCRSAMRTLDAQRFYRKWINDIADCQDRISGHVQYTAPYSRCGGGPGGWGIAIVVLPYEYWKMYGDDQPMREMFDGMLEYFRYLEDHSHNDLVVSDREGEWCLGEWCTPGATGSVILPAPFVNNYFYVKGMTMAIEIAQQIGREEVVPMLEARIEARKKAIMAAYFNTWDGNFVGNVQGANAFALDIGLGDARTLKNFIAHYENAPYYDTGIFGTDIVTRLLFERGRGDLAVRLMTASEPHGFGYWMEKNATTFWEYWTVPRSYSHPMFGSVVAYLFEYLLGIQNREGCGGYETVDIKPVMIDGLTQVSGHLTTRQGRIGVSHVQKTGRTVFSFAVPKNTEAQIFLPNGESHTVGEGSYTYTIFD